MSRGRRRLGSVLEKARCCGNGAFLRKLRIKVIDYKLLLPLRLSIGLAACSYLDH